MSEYKRRFLAPVKPMGLPWWLALAIVGVVFAAEYTGALSADIAGCFALMLSIGIVCDEVGERIPFWNLYWRRNCHDLHRIRIFVYL